MKYITLLLFTCITSQLCSQFSDQIIIAESETSRPTFVYAIDLDGDGDNDVLSSSYNDGKIAWYANLDGLGTFGTQQIISNEALGATSVFPADLDGDGDIDVLSSSQNPNGKITWFRNEDGLGSFSSPLPISIELDNAVKVFATDVDSDGDIDVLSASDYDNKIAWYENEDGSGGFSEQKVISSFIELAENVHAADLDGDGDQDAISASGWDGAIRWFKFDQDSGDFGYGGYVHDNQGDWPTHIHAGDLDNDGDLDVLGNSDIDKKVSWFRNEDGLGNFSDEIIISEDVRYAKTVFPADLDGDDDLDVLFSGFVEIGWFENEDGNGTFSAKKNIYSNIHFPKSVFPADLDGDNDLDVLSASLKDDKIAWYRNEDGLGNFGDQRIISEPGVSGATSIFSTDLNNDGLEDIITASGDADRISWFQNLGGFGSFSQEIIIADSVHNPESIFAIDLDNDNFIDVLSASSSDDKVIWYKNIDGTGQMSEGQIISDSLDAASYVIASDLDGDLDFDVIATSINDDKVVWYENLGSGSFSSELLISNNLNGANSVFSADIDNDGDFDIITSSRSDDKVSCFLNLSGQGDFSQEIVITENADGVTKVITADLDNNGSLDIISASSGDNKLAWYKNLGAGNFSEELLITNTISDFAYVFSFDFDNDGDNDLISSSRVDDVIYLYENIEGNGLFEENIITNKVNHPRALDIADLDNDGDLDIISASYSDDKIAWYKNLLEKSKISVISFLDENSNSIFDQNESTLNNQLIEILPSSIESWGNSFGESKFLVDTGLYTLNIFPAFEWDLTTPSEISVEITPDSLDYNNFFGLIPNQENYNVELSINSGPTRCGFIVPFWLNVKNKGTKLSSGEVVIKLDSLIAFINATPSPTLINGQTLKWDYSNLPPTHEENIFLELQMPGVEHLGSLMNLLGESLVLDENQNTIYTTLSEYQSVLNCAYDPNDKLVSPDRIGEENYITIDDTLVYTIRFQNTGTDTAFNVIITDQLDENLDINTFEPLNSSHNFETKLYDNNLVEFLFHDILLPDSSTNFTLSQGFIQYTILPKENLIENTEIVNSANIYFDFNPPILTNQTLNTIIDEIPVEIKDLEAKNNKVNIYPNPFSGYIYFDLLKNETNPDLNLIIYNNIGQMVKEYFIGNTNLFKVHRNDLRGDGIYFYLVYNRKTNQIIDNGKLIAY